MKYKQIGRSFYDEMVWIDAMTQAIGGLTHHAIEPAMLVSRAAKIADAALGEYQKRTPPEDE